MATRASNCIKTYTKAVPGLPSMPGYKAVVIYSEEYVKSGDALGDTLQMIPVESGDVVLDGVLDTDDLGTGVQADVGDGNGVGRFVNDQDAASATNTWPFGTGTSTKRAFRYTTADTLDVTLVDGGSGALTADGTKQIRLWALLLRPYS